MKVMTHTYTYTTLFIHAKLNTISNNRFSSIDVALNYCFYSVCYHMSKVFGFMVYMHIIILSIDMLYLS